MATSTPPKPRCVRKSLDDEPKKGLPVVEVLTLPGGPQLYICADCGKIADAIGVCYRLGNDAVACYHGHAWRLINDTSHMKRAAKKSRAAFTRELPEAK